MKVIGLMSGTSADAVDAALVEWPEGEAARPFALLAFAETPLPEPLQERVHGLAAGRVAGERALAELAALDVLLGERFAEAARDVAARAGVALGDVAAVASHGQTVAHHPEQRATLQIGNAARIAERCGRPVISDFRSRDLAAGGEGAPLAPFFHHAALADPGEGRLVLNLGGIANVTWLPRGARAAEVLAFDVGPANALLDGVLRALRPGERFDEGGARALCGQPDAALLAELLDDDFLRRPPPKSTGRERYGMREAEALAQRWRQRPLDDLLATLAAFSAEAVARACRDFLPAQPAAADSADAADAADAAAGRQSPVERVWVCGGGARNAASMAQLSARLAAPVRPLDESGVPAAAAEAMAFSLMGRNALLGLPNHLPHTTGAQAPPRILGQITPA